RTTGDGNQQRSYQDQFWILDFGFWRSRRIRALVIQNRKSKIQNRLAAFYLRGLGCGLFLVEVLLADEVVFLGVVAERAERHPKELGGLCLDAVASVERLAHQPLADRLEVRLEVDPLGGKALEVRNPRSDAESDRLRQARGGDDRPGLES